MPLFTESTAFRIIDSVAVVLAQAHQLARARMAACASPVLRLIAHRDQLARELELLRRELGVLRGQRENLAPHRRPEYSPDQRLAILQIMRLRGWNAKDTAERFVLHSNTVRDWIKAVDGRRDPSSLLGRPRWNRIDDAVRYAIHELRGLCPQPEFGTRTIARHLVRAGIQLSRATVQRVLREDKPSRPPRRRPPLVPAAGVEPHHLLIPAKVNQTWQLDLTTLRLLWCRFTIAALIDGFSRKLLALRVYAGSANSRDMINLVRAAVRTFGKPRFLITDHGCQFREQFKQGITRKGITSVKGQVRCPSFNGKIERFFRTLRQWLRFTLLPLGARALQRRLNVYRNWYNTSRPHSALGFLTPEEVWRSIEPPDPIPIRAREELRPMIDVQRSCFRGDPRLAVVQIGVALVA